MSVCGHARVRQGRRGWSVACVLELFVRAIRQRPVWHDTGAVTWPVGLDHSERIHSVTWYWAWSATSRLLLRIHWSQWATTRRRGLVSRLLAASYNICDYYPFDAQCCHMSTAVKHPVPDGVKPSFVIFDIRALWRSGLSVRVPR